jgi:hypothetical protein
MPALKIETKMFNLFGPLDPGGIHGAAQGANDGRGRPVRRHPLRYFRVTCVTNEESPALPLRYC